MAVDPDKADGRSEDRLGSVKMLKMFRQEPAQKAGNKDCAMEPTDAGTRMSRGQQQPGKDQVQVKANTKKAAKVPKHQEEGKVGSRAEVSRGRLGFMMS